jgi:hypothetical protein
MKRNPLIATFCFCSIVLPCSADTFTLKDGTVFEGTVLSEDADSYTLEVQVTKSIKDERKVAKADVAKVAREQLDLTAFVEIGKLVPVPDFLTEDDYKARISAVEKFLAQNRGSLKTKDAKEILETLKAEFAQIAAGAIKYNGQIISASDYQANAYDLDARIHDSKIRALVADNQVLLALRAFSEFDRDYRTTLSYGSLAPFMSQVVRRYVEELQSLLAGIDARLKEREVGLERMAPEDRRVTANAIKEENAAIEARYQSEKTGVKGWLIANPFHKASITDNIAFGESEMKRLAAVPTVLGVDGGKAYREAHSAVQGAAPIATVTAAINAAKTAKVAPSYLEPLEARAKSLK